jgi:hypothetical protein
MIDKRSLLLGLGIGLVAGALLLQLMLVGREQSERLADIDRLSGEDALYTQSEVDALIAEAEERLRRQLRQEPAGEGTDAGNAVDRPSDEGAREGDPPSGAGDPAVNESGQHGEKESGDADGADSAIEVRIRPGMTLTETAELLESEGVIEDANALMELMARMSTKIRAGYYTFTGNETLEEIRTILTSPPSE